ncbi:MAG: class D beta-lactamase [Chitinophagaceae bacterium]|nr:class D beta-lactamase [Chitinophagaceae bacterium]
MRSLLMGMVVYCLALVSCSPNNVTEDNSLKKHFDAHQLSGSFGMFDNSQGQFTVYNLPRFRDSAYLPASTFKIVNSLIGIQTGTVKDENTVIPWDGITRSIPEWNRDLTMKDAFQVSAVPWFQELARRIGKDTMQQWLDTLGYAAYKSRAVINKIDTFWLDNSIKTTADEQLGLVKRLYFEQLPFFSRTQQIVRRMMLREDNTNYKLSYKTGWASTEKGHTLGWLVGWIEENKHPYFFVLQVESPDKKYDLTTVRLTLLKEILKQYGFMEGKK